MMRYWAEPERFATLRGLLESGGIANPLLARQIQLAYLSSAKAQQDEETIEQISQLEAEIRQAYYNFRGEVGGQPLNDNELDQILAKSDDSDQVRSAWEASKQIGAQVADKVRELVRVRNRAARAQGYRDHFQKALTLSEINEDRLLERFSQLEKVTQSKFQDLKAEIDKARAARFGIGEDELYPWHFGDRFFQDPPETSEVDMDAYFADKDPVGLAKATYEGLGLEVGEILERSDLYAREGKNQHAFCIDMDREGDIRTLNNLEPNLRWNETLLHELGHASYDKYIDRDLPWILRKPAHSLTTEAIAIMMGSLVYERGWLVERLDVPNKDAERLAREGRELARASGLIFARWGLVMTNFERALYANPEGDLETLWWSLVERFQHLRRPPDRKAADWAAKYHVALAPVYYQNYILGHLVKAQFNHQLQADVGGLAGKRAGAWLIERVFRPGASQEWATFVETVTDEQLNPRYFVDSLG
jgi:peptidyl-dipeptidase A